MSNSNKVNLSQFIIFLSRLNIYFNIKVRERRLVNHVINLHKTKMIKECHKKIYDIFKRIEDIDEITVTTLILLLKDEQKG